MAHKKWINGINKWIDSWQSSRLDSVINYSSSWYIHSQSFRRRSMSSMPMKLAPLNGFFLSIFLFLSILLFSTYYYSIFIHFYHSVFSLITFYYFFLCVTVFFNVIILFLSIWYYLWLFLTYYYSIFVHFYHSVFSLITFYYFFYVLLSFLML